MLSLDADGMGTMLQFLTSILVFIAALHVVHAEQCTPHPTTDQLELVCKNGEDNRIDDANWYKDEVLISNSTGAGITVYRGTVRIPPMPSNEGIYSCNSSTGTPGEPACFIVQGILA